MTTLTAVVDVQEGEDRSTGTIRRLRAEFQRLNLSASEAARRAHMTQDQLSRRLTGRVMMTIGELDGICRAIGASYTYVTTGIRVINGQGRSRGARAVEVEYVLPRLDSNQQPFGPRSHRRLTCAKAHHDR